MMIGMITPHILYNYGSYVIYLVEDDGDERLRELSEVSLEDVCQRVVLHVRQLHQVGRRLERGTDLGDLVLHAGNPG